MQTMTEQTHLPKNLLALNDRQSMGLAVGPPHLNRHGTRMSSNTCFAGSPAAIAIRPLPR